MMKRVIALLLCLLMLLPCVVSCAKNELDKGAYIRMYLSEKIYDFDPLNAFTNADHLQIISLLFSGLFYADENGKPQKDLVDEYEYRHDKDEDRYLLTLSLKDTQWSDGVPVTASHVQYAFRRLFSSDASHPATAMLYDIKNARAIVKGDASVDDLQVSVAGDEVEIEFEKDIDVDAFLLTLCSPALYPMRDDIVEFNPDWAKKTTTMVCSGPFKVSKMQYEEKDGFILERNSYYFRDRQKDDLDKYVTPYRLVCDYTTPIEEQLQNFDTRTTGSIYFLGNIPLEGRTTADFAELLKKGKLTDAASTHVYYMNENVEINGKKLFADPAVRQALSLALDREAIAEALVFAEAANGLVPNAILNRPNRSKTFRKAGGEIISTLPNVQLAKETLANAGIKASDYSFTICVSAADTDHAATAELAKAVWEELGFKVSIEKLGVETAYKKNEFDDTFAMDSKTKKPVEAGYFNDIYADAAKDLKYYTTTLEKGESSYTAIKTEHIVQVIAVDLVATGADAFSYLAPFATAFSGNAAQPPEYNPMTHVTGYQSDAYNQKIEAAYAEQNQKKRAELLHEAEELLMADMPVIPVVYNKNFAIASSKLGKISSSFFCNAIFTKTSLSKHWSVAVAEGFVEE